jgi:RimJ/RimL family protein N-acetyltransferase
VIYRTPRLTIRPWTTADADVDRIFDIYSRWEVARWLGAQPRALADRSEAERAATRFASRSEPDPTFGVWAVEVGGTGVVAGSVLLVPLPGDTGEIEVGWHLHPDSWGHGYATEAAVGALERAFAAGIPEVFAVVRPGNDASMAVCRRLGMTPIGRTDKWYGVECEAFRITAPSAG